MIFVSLVGRSYIRRLSYLAVGLAALCLMSGCNIKSTSGGETGDVSRQMPVDTAAMSMLAGMWMDEDTGALVMRIYGDSIAYADSLVVPARFLIRGDTLIVDGNQESYYPIEEMTGEVLYYTTLTGESIHLMRSHNPADSIAFVRSLPAAVEPAAVELDRDTVMFSPEGKRYHLYVKVNPSLNKVYSTSYNEEGMAVRTAYYDNIVHIGVFSGSNRVCSHDFRKNDFKADYIPASFLESAVLCNIEFGCIDHEGIHFQAVLTQPEGYTSYVSDIVVSYHGDITIVHPE